MGRRIWIVRVFTAASSAALLGCGGPTQRIGVAMPSYPRATSAPGPTSGSLGEHGVGRAPSRVDALITADSVLEELGWGIMAVNAERGELRTDWLYVRGATFVPGDADLCDNGQEVGVRFWFAPRHGGDSTEFGLRAEIHYPPRTDPGESERAARDAFDVVTKTLKAALAASPARDESAPAPKVTGQIATGTTGWRGCGGIRS